MIKLRHAHNLTNKRVWLYYNFVNYGTLRSSSFVVIILKIFSLSSLHPFFRGDNCLKGALKIVSKCRINVCSEVLLFGLLASGNKG